jgi:alpha-mannosidase
MLRTAFPTEIVTTEAACEIQFGHIKRPTHKNTTWEQAQYEVCAQKWVDLCDHTYGVALLNDSKYGHQVFNNVLDLNLLRSPTFPDPKADRARHDFTYSLYPHIGNTIDGEVIQRAYELNIPLRVLQMRPSKGSLPLELSLVRLESTEATDGRPCPVIIECVKKAEDNGDILIRMYESTGATSRIRMRFGFEITRAYAVDLMERPVKNLNPRGNTLKLEFKPFEIKTVAVATRE